MERQYGPWNVRVVKRLAYAPMSAAMVEPEPYEPPLLETKWFIEAHYEHNTDTEIPTWLGIVRLKAEVRRDFALNYPMEIFLHLPSKVAGMQVYAYG